MDSVLNCLVTDDVGPGSAYLRLLGQAKEIFACEYAAAFRSPIDALRTALEALGLEKGSGVIVSALSPDYYYYVIKDQGFEPLVADVNPQSGAIDPVAASALAPQNARAIIVSGSLGIMSDFERLLELGLPIVEDVSQTIGAFVSLRKSGDSGTLVLMSLESDSYVTAGEGALLFAKGKREGAVLKNLSEALPREMLMSDMNASLAMAQLRDLAKFYEKRKELYALFHRSLLQSRHAVLEQEGEGEPSYFAFPVVLRSGAKEVRSYARKKEIETLEAFEGTIISKGRMPDDACPQARSIALRCLLFPLHLRVGRTAAQKIVKVLATLP
jgi:perosamine synthetase